MNWTVVYSVAGFLLTLFVLIFVRAKYTRFEIKPSDIVVAVVPVVVALLVTGKLQKFEIGEGGVKIETAFVDASKSPITGQVAPIAGLPADAIPIDEKRGMDEIPRLIERKTEGLLFRLNQGGYYGRAIEEYVLQLSKAGFLKYIVFENPDRTFFGIASARDIAAGFQAARPPVQANDLAQWINNGNREALSHLPGFVGTADAVGKAQKRGDVLKRMERMNADTLPVVDEQRKFVGIVNRSRVTASLLIDVAASLDSK